MRREFEYEVLSPREAGIDFHKHVRSGGESDTEELTVQSRNVGDHIDVLLLRGFCPTGGYDLRVLDAWMIVTAQKAEVSVLVKLIDPRPEDMVTMAFTRPAKVIRFYRDELPQDEKMVFSVRDSDSRLLARDVLDL